MKTIIVRTSVLALAFAAFGASSLASHAMKSEKTMIADTQAPTPLCGWDDPTHCGMH